MKKLHTLLMAACAAAFLAGCGDSGSANPKDVAKAAAKGAKAADVKTTGNAVADYKAMLDKLVDMNPRIQAYAKAQSKSSSLAQIEDMANWGKLVSQLMVVWKQAKPEEREQLKKHADTVLEKLEEGDERNALLGTLMGIHMSAE